MQVDAVHLKAFGRLEVRELHISRRLASGKADTGALL